jgi:hypothetical protein
VRDRDFFPEDHQSVFWLDLDRLGGLSWLGRLKPAPLRVRGSIPRLMIFPAMIQRLEAQVGAVHMRVCGRLSGVIIKVD